MIWDNPVSKHSVCITLNPFIIIQCLDTMWSVKRKKAYSGIKVLSSFTEAVEPTNKSKCSNDMIKQGYHFTKVLAYF